MKKNAITYALLHAVLTAAYVGLVGTLMQNGEKIFGQVDDVPFAPAGFLLLFVISAAITGLLVFARPIMWYLDGAKRDAIRLALYTVGFLVVITIAVFAALIAS